MPVHRTAANQYAIQLIGYGGTGAHSNSAGWINGGGFVQPLFPDFLAPPFPEAPRIIEGEHESVSEGAISGTSDAIFGQSGLILGLAALGGTASATFGQSGDLAAIGELTGSSTALFGQSGALTAVGELAGSSAALFGQSGALTAIGELTGSSASLFGQSGALTAVGELTGSSAALFGQSGALVGTLELAGTASAVFSQNGTLTGIVDTGERRIYSGSGLRRDPWTELFQPRPIPPEPKRHWVVRSVEKAVEHRKTVIMTIEAAAIAAETAIIAWRVKKRSESD